MSASRQPLEIFEGVVEKKRINVGSKSEQDAYLLRCMNATYKLRRKDGPAFRDTFFEEFILQNVKVKGKSNGKLLVVFEIISGKGVVS
ncbi:MAG: hypothetical protein SH856_00485 [Flavobacteriales bacterium]|nr:hypothetical protein [Flavobacteriales bacterium]